MSTRHETMVRAVAPIAAALQAGIPVGKVRSGEPVPDLPKVPMIVLLDDPNGDGPNAFDAIKLFEEVDSVIFVSASAFDHGASLVAARAQNGERALLLQSPASTMAAWLEMVIGHDKLMRNYVLLGIGDTTPKDIHDMTKEIKQRLQMKTN